ncbi:hypothetical protein ACVI1L_000673 [Bradyrhizobium sp. USDA 4516]
MSSPTGDVIFVLAPPILICVALLVFYVFGNEQLERARQDERSRTQEGSSLHTALDAAVQDARNLASQLQLAKAESEKPNAGLAEEIRGLRSSVDEILRRLGPNNNRTED